MKKFFTIASLFALTLSACAEKEPQGEQEGKGQVAISCVVSTDVDTTRANVSCTTPQAEDFALTIKGGDYEANYTSLVEFNNGDNYLRYGEYEAQVVAGDIAEEGYDKATFVGAQKFTISARKHTDVEMTATIANALVKVETTENFKKYFEGGYALTLKTAAGNEFDVTAQSDVLFIAPNSFTVTGTAVKQSAQSGKEGVTVTLPEYKNEALKAQTLYTVKLDVEQAGSAQLTITLNETLVESIDIEQELNDNAQ